MDIRRYVRGTLDWNQLEGVGQELARRLDQEVVRIEVLETDNWLSTPLVVDDSWFVKVITPQNAIVQGLLTGARNLGAITSGTPGFFDRFEGPVEMGRHELQATTQMREIGVNAPRPITVFEYQGLGVVVLEYLAEFRTFSQLSVDEQREFAGEIFDTLQLMHQHELVHGDLRDDNVLIANDTLYFIDATGVQSDRLPEARAYDIASALAVLGPRIGYRDAVRQATETFGSGPVRDARRYVDFVNFRPDHQFDADRLKEEIDHVLEIHQK